MINKSDVQWMVTQKILTENLFLSVILSFLLFNLSIGTDLSIDLFSNESFFLSLIIVCFNVFNLFLIIKAIRKYPDYVRESRKIFYYAPKRSKETFLFFCIQLLIIISTILFGIFTNTIFQSLLNLAIISLLYLPLKFFFLYFWIKRLPK